MSAAGSIPRPDPAVREALAVLDKRRLALNIHDGCFPALPHEDIGRGSPYSEGGRQFLAFARSLGFDTIQLGPQGQTARDNPSPYDATLFSRNLLGLDLAELARDGLLGQATLERLVAGRSSTADTRTDHGYAYDASREALTEIHSNFRDRRARGDAGTRRLAQALEAFCAQQRDWLETEARYHVDGAPGAGRDAMARYRLGQFLLHRQHAALRTVAARWGLRLYGDLPVGIAPQAGDGLYLRNYRIGAPPSRTNPRGQPWGYGVADPEQFLNGDGSPGPVLRHLAARVGKLMREYDGLRIDHPHGLVCPWVYRSDDADPHHAVCNGARLFSSPALPGHPELARYAIARTDQLNAAVAPYADDWVRWLEPGQVDRYAVLMDALMACVRAQGASVEDVACEILSTLPYPLARVIERYGLGRFRVTQKADLDNPDDVYRSENALPEDWIMVANHDTPPVWHVVRRWQADGRAGSQAAYLARRLVPPPERDDFARSLAADHRRLAHAQLADALLSPAAHVLVFFADLLGMEAIYNRPGTVAPDNWSLRVPPDYAARYCHAAARGEALDLSCVLALALRARGGARVHGALIGRLQGRAGWFFGGTNSSAPR